MSTSSLRLGSSATARSNPLTSASPRPDLRIQVRQTDPGMKLYPSTEMPARPIFVIVAQTCSISVSRRGPPTMQCSKNWFGRFSIASNRRPAASTSSRSARKSASSHRWSPGKSGVFSWTPPTPSCFAYAIASEVMRGNCPTAILICNGDLLIRFSSSSYRSGTSAVSKRGVSVPPDSFRWPQPIVRRNHR